MKGDLAVEFSSNAGAATPTKPALSADFGVASGMGFPTTDADPPKLDEEFQLGQKAHVLEQGGSTNDDRVRRYAELTGTGVQQQGERKEKDERSFRAQLALRSQAELRERLDGMRAGLLAKIDQRLGELQTQLLAQQSDNERLRRIQLELKDSRTWPLGKDDTEFLKRKAGQESFENIKSSHESREQAYVDLEKNPTQENRLRVEATEKKLDQSMGVVVEAEAKKERDIEAEIDRVEELKREVDRPGGPKFDVGPDGRFTDKLLQRAAEKAGIDPATFDALDQDQNDKLFIALDAAQADMVREIEGTDLGFRNGALKAEKLTFTGQTPLMPQQ